MVCEVNVGAIFNVSVQGRWNDAADVYNVFQVRKEAGAEQSLGSAALDLRDIFDDLYSLVSDFCNALVSFHGITAQHLNGNCSTGFVNFVSAIDGVLVNDPVPPGVAILMSYRTGIKRVVTRKYYGGLDEAVIGADGRVAAAYYANVNAVRDFLMSPLQANNSTWAYGYLSPKTAEWQVPISGAVSLTPAYQRRRRPGTGS